MSSKREIDRENQILFRNEMLNERKVRMESSAKIIKDILDNYECGDDVDKKLLKAYNILGGYVEV